MSYKFKSDSKVMTTHQLPTITQVNENVSTGTNYEKELNTFTIYIGAVLCCSKVELYQYDKCT